MKTSKYTFLFDVNGKEFYTYNTLSNALVEIDEESYALLRQKGNGTALSKADFDKELWDALCANNILTDRDRERIEQGYAHIGGRQPWL